MWHITMPCAPGRGAVSRMAVSSAVAHRIVKRIDLRPACRRLQRIDADAAIHQRIAQIRPVEAARRASACPARCRWTSRPDFSRSSQKCLRALRHVLRIAFEHGDQRAGPSRRSRAMSRTLLQFAFDARRVCRPRRTRDRNASRPHRKAAAWKPANLPAPLARMAAAPLAKSRNRKPRKSCACGNRMHAELRFGDDAERAFRSDEEIGQARPRRTTPGNPSCLEKARAAWRFSPRSANPRPCRSGPIAGPRRDGAIQPPSVENSKLCG